MTSATAPKLLTPREVAGILRVNRETIYRFIREGRLRAFKLSNKAIRIRTEDVERLFVECSTDGDLRRMVREAK